MPSSIEDEQTFIDHAHSLLDQHIDHLRSRISSTTNAPSTGTGQDELEREALLDNLHLQLHAAEAARPRMCFGRLRFNGGDDHHIGRIGMRDEAGDILLIDWRAPQAAPFYQATSKNPMDVVLRRRIGLCIMACFNVHRKLWGRPCAIVPSEEWISENTLPDGMAMQNKNSSIANPRNRLCWKSDFQQSMLDSIHN